MDVMLKLSILIIFSEVSDDIFKHGKDQKIKKRLKILEIILLLQPPFGGFL